MAGDRFYGNHIPEAANFIINIISSIIRIYVMHNTLRWSTTLEIEDSVETLHDSLVWAMMLCSLRCSNNCSVLRQTPLVQLQFRACVHVQQCLF
jgi:hypothetical protein